MPEKDDRLSYKRRRSVASERMLILKVGYCRLDYLFFDVMNDESNTYTSPTIANHPNKSPISGYKVQIFLFGIFPDIIHESVVK